MTGQPLFPAGGASAGSPVQQRAWRGRAFGAGMVLLPLTGLVAGAAFASSTQPPALTGPRTPDPAARIVAVSAPAGSTSPDSPLAAHQTRTERAVRRALKAYAAAGYTYDDAVDLARIWKIRTPRSAKLTAGRTLLAHRPMPLPPSAEPTLYWRKHQSIDELPAADAFFGAGYDISDAATLAALWNLNDSYDAKIKAGTALLRQHKLRILPGQPSAGQDPEPTRARAVMAFADAGYDYDDALVLASYWNTGDPTDAKVIAGRKLINGLTMPIQPGGQLTDEQAQDARDAAALSSYFGAGYDYDDAVTLAKLWSSPSAYDAKITAGTKLGLGEHLPIEPGSAA